MVATDRFTLSDCTVDLVSRQVIRDGDTSPLTAQEAALLRYLAERRGQTVGRAALFADVLGYAATSTSRALDAAVRRVRRRIEPDPREPVHLLTVRGDGFTLQWGEASRPLQDLRMPRRADAFVGRAELVVQVGRALAEARVVTLHGPGGVGKSRLAAEVLGAEGTSWAAVVWVEVPRGDAATLVGAVAAALQLAPGGTAPDLALITALGARPGTVVVLDAAEVAPEAVRAVVGSWLRAEVGCRVLATSRETLGCGGEQVVGVPPLSDADAVRLLALRAASRGASGWDEGPELQQLAAALDGLPLALELAAARAPVLRPSAVAARLDARFRVLRGRGAGRIIALEAVFEASWTPLEVDLRAALVQLSVLSHPFDMGLAERVVVLEHELALDAVQELVRRSWLPAADPNGDLRWLDSVRDFVRARSAEVPGAAAGARERLAAAVEAGVGMDWAHAIDGARTAVASGRPEAAAAVAHALRLLRGRTDLRTGLALADEALARVADHQTVALAVAPLLVHAGSAEAVDRSIEVLREAPASSERDLQLGGLLLGRARFAEAVGHLRAVLAAAPDHAGARNALATALLQRGDTASAIEVVAGRPEPELQGLLGMAHRGLGQLDMAEPLFQSALVAHAAAGDARGVAVVQANLLALYIQSARLADAEGVGAAALDTLQRLGDLRASSSVRLNLAVLADIVGDEARSAQLFAEALRVARWAGDRRQEILVRMHQAYRQVGRVEPDRAAVALRGQLDEVQALRMAPMEVLALCWLGVLEGSEQRLRDALALAEHLGDDGQRVDVLIALASLLADSDPDAATAILHHARRAVRDQQVSGALVVQLQVAAARVATASGDARAVRNALKAADAELDKLGVRPTAYLRREVEAARSGVGATS